ncbi:helix-turn-helix transcriptional regulator [Pseudomonas jessenii]|uniref:helix-turn-helix transcriptional regulator n=1 Tax=Pseudomonas jessenii TaxID=77298 RepID=UPI0030C07896
MARITAQNRKATEPSAAVEASHHFIKLATVKALTTLSTSEIYRRIEKGTFPKQVLLGPKSAVWIEAEVLEWQRTHIAARNVESVGDVA